MRRDDIGFGGGRNRSSCILNSCLHDEINSVAGPGREISRGRNQGRPDRVSRVDRPAAVGTDGGPPVVVAVGRLVPKKGVDVLVEACARLTSPYRLVIVAYAIVGLAIAIVLSQVSARIEVTTPGAVNAPNVTRIGLYRSRGVVLR